MKNFLYIIIYLLSATLLYSQDNSKGTVSAKANENENGLITKINYWNTISINIGTPVENNGFQYLNLNYSLNLFTPFLVLGFDYSMGNVKKSYRGKFRTFDNSYKDFLISLGTALPIKYNSHLIAPFAKFIMGNITNDFNDNFITGYSVGMQYGYKLSKKNYVLGIIEFRYRNAAPDNSIVRDDAIYSNLKSLQFGIGITL